jgi:hypothetical protein
MMASMRQFFALLALSILLLVFAPVLIAAPTISSLSPTSGAVGASVTISGSGFGSTQGSGTVKFNGKTATVASWSASSIVAIVPTGATTGNVVVTVSGVASNGKKFTVLPAPSITSLSPTSGAVGTSVTISGANFGATQGSSTVKFNGTTATATSWSASTIRATVPPSATTGNVVVHASGVDSNGVNFMVQTLVSISVAPQNPAVPVGATQQFTATGTYSDGSTANITATVAWSSSDTAIAAIGTAGLATGVAQGQTTIQAAMGSINGSSLLTVTPSRFKFTASLNTPRRWHTATRLTNGKILITGGDDGNGPLATCELYDPGIGAFSGTGSLIMLREAYTATLLSDGKILIVGGWSRNSLTYLSSAELYDFATGTFSATGPLNIARGNHTATLLNNGKVLIVGGNDNTFSLQPAAELYDPASGTFSMTGNLNTLRANHTATLLNDGNVLIAGGQGASGSAIANAETYDPTTGTFTATGSLNTASQDHAATLLTNGKILVAGGYNVNSAVVPRAELYNPATRTFTLTGSLITARQPGSATLLGDGTVLIVGGNGGTSALASTELYDPAVGTFSLVGDLNTARNSHAAALLDNGTVLIAGGQKVVNGNLIVLGSAEIYEPAGTVPSSLQVTPANANMLVGETRQFTVVDNLGHPRTDAVWMVSDTSLATITSDSSPTLTAVAAGQVTLTATIATASAQAQITISPSGTPLTAGTVLWSAPTVPGFSPLQLAQAVPTDTGPDLYIVQSTPDGAQAVVQALTSDGQQMWQVRLPAVNGNSVPDAYGGVLVTQFNTCDHINPMKIVDLDPLTGQARWQIAGASTCTNDAPQFAISGDGTVVMAAPGNTSGFPELMVLNGQTGQSMLQPAIPTSSYTQQNGQVIQGYSPIGPPMVDSDGSTYIEYEVRTVAYPPRITSAFLWLLKIAPDFTSTTTQLSSTTADQNLFPGRIIPDGQGGVLASWTITPSSGPPPARAYQVAHVTPGGMLVYDLPIATPQLTIGPNGLPVNPALVLGQNGTAFASDGATVASFDLDSGLANWGYPAPAQTTVSLLAAIDNGGIAINNSQQGIFELDTTGSAVQITSGSALSRIGYSWGGAWNAFSGLNSAGVVLPLAVDFANLWATPAGTPSQSNSPDALCDCLVETTDPDPPPPPATCPICNLAGNTILPGQPPSCTSTAGALSKYLILVGDPSTDPQGGHNLGNLLNLSAQTQANSLQAQGHPVAACRVSTIQQFNQALTTQGLIDGEVIFFGHAGHLPIIDNPGVFYSLVSVGQGTDDNANISYINVATLSNAQLGPSVTITLNACNAGKSPSPGQPPVALLIANQLKRDVKAYQVGMYFSQNPNDTQRGGIGKAASTLPIYMLPQGGVPKPRPTLFIGH